MPATTNPEEMATTTQSRTARTIPSDDPRVAQRLFTDGAEVLFDYAEQRDEKDLLDLVVVRTGQHQFSDLVRDYLQRIAYGTDGWASEVELPSYTQAHVIVNSEVAFGLPFVTDAGARIEDLVDRFLAGDTLGDIAADFDLPAAEVEDVIRVATRKAKVRDPHRGRDQERSARRGCTWRIRPIASDHRRSFRAARRPPRGRSRRSTQEVAYAPPEDRAKRTRRRDRRGRGEP
jgi:uncharacterized protein (DUF433 family)